MDTLEIQLLEQIACDRALEYAQYEDAPWVEPAEPDEEAVDQSAATTPEDEAKQAEGEPAAAAESAETKA